MSDPHAPDRSNSAGSGRRASARARSWVSRTGAIGGVLALLTVGVAAVVPQRHEQLPAARAPKVAALSDITLVCPPAEVGKATTWVANGTLAASGEVQVSQAGAATATQTLQAAQPLPFPTGSGQLAVSAEADAAPGLIAGVIGADPAAGTGCQNPAPEHWFAGLGASPRHSSQVVLVNPDPGPAIADLTFFGELGVVEAPDLRGVAVPGGEHLVLDLATRLPSTRPLGVQVTTVRGRLGVFAVDSADSFGRSRTRSQWVTPMTRARATAFLPGIKPGSGSQTLSLLNPGQDQAVVSIRLVTESGGFTPVEGSQVEVPPDSLVQVPLSGALAADAAKGVLGIAVDSSQPLLSSLRRTTPRDLSLAVAADAIDDGLTEAGAAFLGDRAAVPGEPGKPNKPGKPAKPGKADRTGASKAVLMLALSGESSTGAAGEAAPEPGAESSADPSATAESGSASPSADPSASASGEPSEEAAAPDSSADSAADSGAAGGTPPRQATVTVRAYSATGQPVVDKTVQLTAGTASKLKLPASVVWVWVSAAVPNTGEEKSGAAGSDAGDSESGAINGAVRLEGPNGLTVLPLTPVATYQRVPHVGAGSELTDN